MVATANRYQSVARSSGRGVASLGGTAPASGLADQSTIDAALKQITAKTPTTTQQGGTMSAFQKLLEERKGIQDEKMNAQEQQLQKLRTQQNNTAVQNKFARQASLVDLMQQLMTQARRTASQGQRIFM